MKQLTIQTYHLEKDKKIFYVTARSFPDGIAEAFQTLENLDPSICERSLYGISEDKQGKIVYKAGVEEKYNGEGKKYGCETFMITRGFYLAETIVDFMQKLDNIPNAFERLLADPRLDTDFPCIEWYKSDKEVMCMVRMKLDTTLN
jgi:hypothetical protein